jgi:hypothetical protein
VIHKLVEDLTKQEPLGEAASASVEPYAIKKYSKWNLLNVHSWAPAFADFSDDAIYTGVSVMSQNLLGTAVITAGYNANPAHENEKYNINFTYRGLYPIFDIDYSFGNSTFERDGDYINDYDNYIYRAQTRQTVKHHYLRTGVSLPFNISRGAYSRKIQTSTRLTYQRRSEISYPLTQYIRLGNNLMPTGQIIQENIPKMNFFGMEYSLSFQNIRRGTSRDVGTRFGQAINLLYRHSPWGSYDNGDIFGIFSRLYLPGAARYHSLAISNDFQKKTWGTGHGINEDYFGFSNIVGYPRGYSYVENNQMYLFRGTYMMPLWNPDLSLGKFMYLKRLRMNLFFDSAYAQYNLLIMPISQTVSVSSSPASYGAELHADTHFFRFVVPFSIGARVGYRTEDKNMFAEFILQTGLSGFLVN